MNYPVWELAMGSGMLIAVVSITHVFVSHFAVGGGLWLVITEMRANRAGDEEMRSFVKKHARFFLLLTLVFGAISGVGIWGTIGLISPHGTSALIHGYVWGWAMEWVFFFIEIAAALVYYYGWEKLDRKTHETVGWIYFIAAFMSLVIINGIITFMLTPGGWLENHDFWTGFFNPTYWPSVVLRTFAGTAIAGIFTLMTAAQLARGDFRTRMTRWNGGWAFVSMLLVLGCAYWYGQSITLWEENEALAGAIPILPTVMWWFQVGLIATTVLALIPLLLPKVWNQGFFVVLAVVGFLTMGAGEWVRESGRKPFTIQGYLYSNGMLAERPEGYDPDDMIALEDFEDAGMVAGTKWMSPAAANDQVTMGRDLFRAWCQPCHTLDGYNGLRPYLAHWNEETVASMVPRIEWMRALMPPWYATEEENEALTAYLMTLKPEQDAVLPAGEEGEQLAWDISCGRCHTEYGYMSLAWSFEDYTYEEAEEFLLYEAGDMADEMPAYYGTDEQREALARYLVKIGESVAEETSDEGSES